jgi:transposase
MAKPYSYDLRCKVMAAIEQDGMKRCEASTVFQISRHTINLWFQQKAATGMFSPNGIRILVIVIKSLTGKRFSSSSRLTLT